MFGDAIDYMKLRQHIEQETKDVIDEAYFFNADTDPPRAEKLHNALTYPPPRGPGFRVKIYWVQKRSLFWPPKLGGHPIMHPTIPNLQFEQFTQKAVDVGLIYHMTRSFYKRKWTHLVLAAGDADFYEPVQHLVEIENVELSLIGSMQATSQDLRPYARRIVEIDQEPLHSKLMRS